MQYNYQLLKRSPSFIPLYECIYCWRRHCWIVLLCNSPTIHERVPVAKQSWHMVLVEVLCWLSACCSCSKDIVLYGCPWSQWDGQDWQGEAEAPVDARGSLVLLSAWALLALRWVTQQTTKTRRWCTAHWWRWHRGLLQSSLSTLEDAVLVVAGSEGVEFTYTPKGRNGFLEKVVRIWLTH